MDRFGGTRAKVEGREFFALMATCMGMAALSIDLLLPAFPDMRESFGLDADSTEISWVITAFFIGLAVGQLFYGPMSDRYGRKRMLYVGLFVYVVGALASTMTSTLGALVACRFVWGLGAAGPRSLALAMVRDTHEGDRMARLMSHVMATFILVPVFAPGVGALLISFLPWRSVLWVPVAVAIGLALWAIRLPETLPVERRRSITPAALLEAVRAVGRSRTTLAYGAAVTCLFGVMTSFIGSSEIIVDEVFGREDQFPLFFGMLACMLGLGSLLSARLVVRLGLSQLIRAGAFYLIGAASLLAGVVALTGGEPSLLVFGLCTALVLPGVTALVPNLNTAAMGPLPHVAGMASALLGTVSTAGGALLGALVDDAFDGSVQPFAFAAFVYAGIAAVVILVFGRPAESLQSSDELVAAASLAVTAGDVALPGEALEPT
jgi:MFS transporter, DHA1 family, multidrug resistance protein